MIVRNIRPEDLNQCVRLAEETVIGETIYKGCTISKQKIRKLMPEVSAHPERWYFRVADDAGRIDGFLWGMIDSMIFSTKDWYATDLLFVVRPNSHCGFLLKDSFTEWYKKQAKRCPGRLIPILGNSSGKPEIDCFYERGNMRYIGGMFTEALQ